MIKKILFIGMVLFFSQLSCMDTLNDAFSSNSRLSMVYVPTGTFQRNATAANTSYVSAFYMAKHLVTRAQFKNVTGYDPSDTDISRASDCPVQMVSWYDAIAFCNRLSIRESLTPVYTISGSTNPDDWGTVPTAASAVWDAAICNMNADGYRLPTEMEWWWAAMGATSGSGDHTGGVYTNGYKKEFAGDPDPETTGDDIGSYAWHSLNSGNNAHGVGTKKPNELGLYDMSGNVYHWFWDGLVSISATSPVGSVIDYQGDGTTVYRIIHGGCFKETGDSFILKGQRYSDYGPDSKIDTVGFRVARSTGKGHIPRSGLVGEWLFDSNGSNITYDTSGFGYDGLNNTVGATPPAFPLLTTDHNGAANSAYSFPTDNDSIKINADPKLKFKYITVSFFIYPVSDGKIIMKDDEGSGLSTFQVELNSTNTIGFLCFKDAVHNADSLISDEVTLNTWHHIACTFDGSMMRIYIDGILNKEQSWTGASPNLNDENVMPIYIGRVKGDVINSASFTGTLDNVRIYNRALSTAEIKLLADE